MENIVAAVFVRRLMGIVTGDLRGPNLAATLWLRSPARWLSRTRMHIIGILFIEQLSPNESGNEWGERMTRSLRQFSAISDGPRHFLCIVGEQKIQIFQQSQCAF